MQSALLSSDRRASGLHKEKLHSTNRGGWHKTMKSKLTLPGAKVSFYDCTRELEEIRDRCCDGLPPLDDHDYKILADLEIKHADAMNENETAFLIKEIYRYAFEQKVFRTSQMGETRGGKSEGAQMLALLQLHYFNKLLLAGHYDNVNVDIKKDPVVFSAQNSHRNRTDYLAYIREGFKNKTLKYGEVNVIDEPEMAAGGLGTMSEAIELRNYNNMVAKYNLGEHWVDPRSLIDMNTTYGIHWFKKDVKNRVNWGILYRLENWSKGINPQTPLGWVCFPLHKNEELRISYEEKKNAWINQVIEGGGDPRVILRKQAAEIVALHPDFGMMKTEKSFKLTNDQQLDIIDDMIAEGKLQGFNAQERERIADRARLIVKRKKFPGSFVDDIAP